MEKDKKRGEKENVRLLTRMDLHTKRIEEEEKEIKKTHFHGLPVY